MRKGLKVILEVFLLLLGIFLVLAFLAFSAKSEIVPDVIITSESGKTAMAVRGGYTWNSFSESVIADSVAPQDYVYRNNNVLLVTPEERLIFKNSDNPLNQYKFYPLEIKYFDDKGNEVITSVKEDSKTYADLKSMEIQVPNEEGTYIYHFRLSYYNKGEVSYGLKVIVSTEPTYEINDFIKYRNTSLKDVTSIDDIIELLPYAKYKEGMIVRTNSEETQLYIDYKTLVVEKEELFNHSLALLTLIPELDLITYKMENENVVYIRTEIENQVGRKLSDYADNVELWKQEILFKEPSVDEQVSRDEIYKIIIDDMLVDGESGDRAVLVVDTKSFAENKFIELSSVDRQEILEHSTKYANTIYDMTKEEYDNIRMHELIIYLDSIKNSTKIILEENESGDKIEREEIEIGKYICKVIALQNGKGKIKNYEVQYIKEPANIGGHWLVKSL